MPHAVVFDLDDTLIDDRTASRVAVREWAAALGLADPEPERRWARISAVHFARYQTREITFAEQRRERVRDFLDRELTDAEADRLFAGYLERYESGWTVFDDAVPALRRARAQGLTIAVLTNGEESQQRRKLDRLALSAEIDLLVASSMLPAGKPDPRAFRRTVALLGIDPAGALMVGDSLEKDVRGAQAAGLSAVLLDREGIDASHGVTRIRSLHELFRTRLAVTG